MADTKVAGTTGSGSGTANFDVQIFQLVLSEFLRNGAIEHSTQDFILKAGQAGALTAQHIDSYNLPYLVTTTVTTTETTRLMTVGIFLCNGHPYPCEMNTAYHAVSANLTVMIIILVMSFLVKQI